MSYPLCVPPEKNQEKFDLIINTERHYIPEIMKFKKTMCHILSPMGRSLSLLGGRKFRLATTSDQTLSPPPGLQTASAPFHKWTRPFLRFTVPGHALGFLTALRLDCCRQLPLTRHVVSQ